MATDYVVAPQSLGHKRFTGIVSSHYKSIPEASDLEWSDDFFVDEEGIVAVFDFDYVQIVDFNTKVAVARLVPTLGCMAAYGGLLGGPYAPFTALAVPGTYLLATLTPCFLRAQVEWEAYAQHVAVTRDGIRFVQDKRKSCWGLSVCDKGRHSKTVPFDKITDCDIVEPAGAEYLCIPRVLMTVNVDTASSGGEGKQFELKIVGLQDAHRFKQLVWAMKRSNQRGSSAASTTSYQAPQTLEMAERGKESTANNPLESVPSGESNSSVRKLLRDIRTELRENNQLLKVMRQTNAQQPGTASTCTGMAAPIETGEMA